MAVQPFKINVPQAILDDLQARLARTRWPAEIEGAECDGDIEKRYTKDELLTNIMLHWIAGIDPRGYREEWVSPSLSPDQQIDIPVGLAFPPKDRMMSVPPREFAERHLKNIQRWTVLPRGGHFVAMEDPESVAADMRAFFRDLKAKN